MIERITTLPMILQKNHLHQSENQNKQIMPI